ncbi:MAG TPA: hypothetical protein VIZ28_07730, partial [Chitinophagaceae bacterium]
MTTTSLMMKRQSIASFFLVIIFSLLLLSSCEKNENDNDHSPAFTAEVLDKWMTLQLRLMRNATGIPNHGFSRHFAYAGVAAFESLAAGRPANNKWSVKWNGLTGLPASGPFVKYYYPANVNAAMAAINRSLFPNANAADKMAIDSLEEALSQDFLTKQSQSVITASSNFGKAVATAVYNWAETDGYKNANTLYMAPTGPGKWAPTAPAFASPATPYWGNNRTVVTGSTENTQPAAPPAYSTDANSPFYQMVKQVYDASQNLDNSKKDMAIYWRDVPGVSSP